MPIKKEALEAVDNLIERLANSIESKPILSGDPSETAKNLNIRTKTLTDLLAARAMYSNNGSLSGESLEEDYERFKKYMTEFAEKDFFKVEELKEVLREVTKDPDKTLLRNALKFVYRYY